MMDLITDFKKLIDKSTNESVQALETIFNDIHLEKNKLFIKNINKYYMVMYLWNNKLKEKFNDEKVYKLLDNVLLDYCSILNCVILGDEKLLNFLYRNIIESVLRIISSNFTTKEIDTLFREICKNCSGCKEKEIVQSYASLLKSIYDKSCLYIHTDTDKIPNDIINLIKYNSNGCNINMDELKKEFEQINIAILCVYQIIYYDVYINFKSNAKGFINEVIPQNNRVKFGEYIKEKQSNRKKK